MVIMLTDKQEMRLFRKGLGTAFIFTALFVLAKGRPVPALFITFFGISLIPYIWESIEVSVSKKFYVKILAVCFPLLFFILILISLGVGSGGPPVANTSEYVSYIDELAAEPYDTKEAKTAVEYIQKHISSFSYDSDVMETLLEKGMRLKYTSAETNSVLMSEIGINTINAVEGIYTKKESIVNSDLVKKILSDCELYLS